MSDPATLSLESLEVSASAVVLHFLRRLRLLDLLAEFLPAAATGCPEKISCATTLVALVGHILLAREPLYAVPAWLARRVPEHFGLLPEQISLFSDDRLGHALERLFAAAASLLTALVLHTVKEFRIDLSQFHNDSTTVTLSGEYANQADPEEENRPPLITRGHSKDHRPDLKQLLYCVTVSGDGAVPIHFKTCDGNTTDDETHQSTWLAVKDLVGHADFLYVADCKLASHANLDFIAGENGRFLTVLPRTWKEFAWMEQYVQQQDKEPWSEVRRQRSRRGRGKPDVVYEGFEYPDKTEGGYRLLCYRSSQKRENDAAMRERKLKAFRQWHERHRNSRKKRFDSEEKADAYGQRQIQEKRVKDWVAVRVEKCQRTHKKQVGGGRPGPDTKYEIREEIWYEAAFEEDKQKQQADVKCDGMFCMITNDESLSVKEALAKYKYQPFLEKRFEQFKTVFEVMPVWLKKPERIAGLMFVYFVVLLVQALLEREVRLKMKEKQITNLPLYPEGRKTKKPTAELVLAAFEGLRRHRLRDGQGQVLRTFHDPLPEVARQLLLLLGIDATPFTAS